MKIKPILDRVNKSELSKRFYATLVNRRKRLVKVQVLGHSVSLQEFLFLKTALMIEDDWTMTVMGMGAREGAFVAVILPDLDPDTLQMRLLIDPWPLSMRYLDS